MGSKNNPKNRTGEKQKKLFNGKEIEPILFVGSKDEGKYVSAKYSKTADLILNSSNRPIRWSELKV